MTHQFPWLAGVLLIHWRGEEASPWLIYFWKARMRGIDRYFPILHGIARLDARRIVSGTIFAVKNGLRRRGAPPFYGRRKTICTRLIHWSRLGVFNKIFAEPAGKGGKPTRIMIDAAHPKAHRPATSVLEKGLFPGESGAPRAARTNSFRRSGDGNGRPFAMQLTQGQMGGFKGPALMLSASPRAKELLAERSYDADGFRKGAGQTENRDPR